MSKPVSMYSGYSGKENRITNYVLLTLRMLYEDNPGYLGQVLGAFIPEDVSNTIGVSFAQQVKKKKSIPDGVIRQKSLAVYIETKNYDWFYDSQLEKHLEALNEEDIGTKVLIVLGNFEKDLETRFDEIRGVIETKYGDSIYFEAVSFENFISALTDLKLPKVLEDAVAELEYFFNEQNLLPKWKTLLDVVNCKGSYNSIVKHGAYLCPTAGGAYSHKRCKYFGAYKNKEVGIIANIDAVVDVEKGGESDVSWTDEGFSVASAIAKAENIVELLKEEGDSVRVFLLGERYETSFLKDTKGGMQQSKLYFDIGSLDASGSADLAIKLHGRVWSEYR